MMENTTKKCNFCAEEILADAIKCKHCGEFVDGINRNHQSHEVATTNRSLSIPILVTSLLVLASVFMPWLSIYGFNLAPFNLFELSEHLNMRIVPDQIYIFIGMIGFASICVLGGIISELAVNKTSVFCALIPILSATTVIAYLSIKTEGIDFISYMGIGAWIFIIASITLLFLIVNRKGYKS